MAQARDSSDGTGSAGNVANTAATSILDPPAIADHAKPETFLRKRSGIPPAADVGKEGCPAGRGKSIITRLKAYRFLDRRNRCVADRHPEKECPEFVERQENSDSRTAEKIFLAFRRTHTSPRERIPTERERKARAKVVERESKIMCIIQEAFS
jgi:hypothetical protein